MKAGGAGRMASFQTDHSKAMFTSDNKTELVLTVEYSSVDSTISHTGFFIPSLPTVTFGYVLERSLDFFSHGRRSSASFFSFGFIQQVAEFSPVLPPHSTKTKMAFASPPNLDNII